MCKNLHQEISEVGQDFFNNFYVLVDDIINSYDLDNKLIDCLRRLIEYCKEIWKFIEIRSVFDLILVEKKMKDLEMKANQMETMNSLAHMTQKLEGFNFFLNILEIELEGEDFFELKEFFDECLENQNVSLKYQQDLLKQLIEEQKVISSSVDEIRRISQDKIIEITESLIKAEREFHGFTFTRKQKLSEFLEKIQFLKDLPLFQKNEPYFEKIHEIIIQSQKEGI